MAEFLVFVVGVFVVLFIVACVVSFITSYQKEIAMANRSTEIFLINDDVRLMKGNWDDNPKVSKPELFKTLDKNIKVDDLVIVTSGTRHGFSIAKVTEVDLEPDMDSVEVVRWIVGPVDLKGHQHTIEKENEAIEMINKARRARKRRNLAEDIFDNVEDVKAIPLSSRK